MLITHEYKIEQTRMHTNERYGAASVKFADQVKSVIDMYQPSTILDYGAGKQALKQAIMPVLGERTYAAYDPGVPAIAELPAGRFDMVCCIDVLEHVEKECLPYVLESIAQKTRNVAILTIHTGPAGKKLSDGRNAHLIQRPIKWWTQWLKNYFHGVDSGMFNKTTIFAACERPKW